ncbi:MAG: glutaredoxin 3 [Rhodospirillaceae bacterium TMED8]|nr:glutaredoxin 3 [Magnetovibrio sp.]OUT53270.1 MAG: glutaredoxin 3 [Rhodospirillaceae bacterium TMED8]|tara:strand:+ start:2277 stop:2534 length:258 start_codon:yes stop_codon:yes gene_type:complete
MPDIQIYTSPFCGFCSRAKSLLASKGVDFEEIDVTMNPGKRQEMAARAGANSVPQIFVDGNHIGDCQKIHDLDATGRLGSLLGIG